MVRRTVLSFVSNRELMFEMAKRDLKGINAGAILGYLWIGIGPLIQIATYVVIVLYVFRTKLSESTSSMDYIVYVLSGMIPWQVITRSLQDAPSIIRDRIELVKQTIYPIETLPFTVLLVSSCGSGITFALLIVFGIINKSVSLALLLVPVPFILLITFIIGVSWILSVAGVILKDLREIISVLLNLMLFVSPVVLSEQIVGPRMWSLIMINPLAHIIVCFRDVFFATFHLTSWIVFAAMAAGAFVAGCWVIMKTKILVNQYI